MGRFLGTLALLGIFFVHAAVAIAPSFETTFVASPMGDKVRVGHWQGHGKKQPFTLVFLQGRGSFLEKNETLMETFASLGFETFALDLPGQGASTRLLPGTQKGHVDDFERYIQAINAVMKDKQNVLLVGVSLGGHLALRVGERAPENLKGIVAIVPMIDVFTDGYPKWAARAMCSVMTNLGFGTSYAPGKGDFNEKKYLFETNQETSDVDRFDEMRRIMLTHKGYVSGGPTFGWIDAAYASMARLREHTSLATIKTPVLFVSAGQDTIVDTRFDADVCARMPACRQKVIEGARHNIPYEKDVFRTQLLRAMMDFTKTLERP